MNAENKITKDFFLESKAKQEKKYPCPIAVMQWYWNTRPNSQWVEINIPLVKPMKKRHFAQAEGLIATYKFYLSVCCIKEKKKKKDKRTLESEWSWF